MYRPNLQSVALPVPEIIAIAVLGWGCEPLILMKGRPLHKEVMMCGRSVIFKDERLQRCRMQTLLIGDRRDVVLRGSQGSP